MKIRTAKILCDENHKPVYVFIDYDEWLTLEPLIESLPSPKSPTFL